MSIRRNESLKRSVGRDVYNALSRPWLLMFSAVTMFVALEGNLGGVFGPSADELRIPDSILFAERDPNFADPEGAARIDEFLQQNGWVEDIVH
jgi:predicted ATP-grasp superfamily ATP-dependent carboligase